MITYDVLASIVLHSCIQVISYLMADYLVIRYETYVIVKIWNAFFGQITRLYIFNIELCVGGFRRAQNFDRI